MGHKLIQVSLVIGLSIENHGYVYIEHVLDTTTNYIHLLPTVEPCYFEPLKCGYVQVGITFSPTAVYYNP